MKEKTNLKNKIKTLLLLLTILLISYNNLNFTGNNSDNDSKLDKVSTDDDYDSDIELIERPESSAFGEDSWWDPDFESRRLINITNPYGVDLVNETTSIKFNFTQLVNEGKMRSDLADVRIVENGVLRKYYFTTEGDIASIWFETNVSANSVDYDTYLYYNNSDAVLPSGYYMDDRVPEYWWTFEDGTGITARDSGKELVDIDGTLQNMQSNDWVSGKIEDYCLDFDGYNDYISTTSDPIPSSGEFSISLWFYPRSSSGKIYDQSIGEPTYYGSNSKYFYIELNGGTLNWEIEAEDDGDYRVYYNMPSGYLNNWHHVVATFGWNGNNHMKLYVDNQQRRDTLYYGVAGKSILNPPNIGYRTDDYYGTSAYFNGRIDDVRIYYYQIENTDLEWLYTNYKLTTALNEEEPQSAGFIVQAVDLYGKEVPFANISIYDGPSDGTPRESKISDLTGKTTFTGLTFKNYNFSVSISSNINDEIIEVVNRTVQPFFLSEISQQIELICNVSRNEFTVLDADNAPVESGWINVGIPNLPGYGEIQKCDIDSLGHASFYWVNKTPYEYNYTVYYQNDNYIPNVITLDSGNIYDADTPYTIYTNLTTINFTIVSTSGPPIPGATLNLTKYGTFNSIVNLTTDQNGIAILRWLNSSGINGNYSLTINFFGNKPFNITTGGSSIYYSFDFKVSSKTSYLLRCSTNPDDYGTEIVLLNPALSFEARWGTIVNVRALFNLSKAVPNPEIIGPVYADTMIYKVLFDDEVILWGTMDREENYEGRHQGVIDTSELESGRTYSIKISATKTGFKPPSDEQMILSLVKNNLIVRQSEDDYSTTEVYWLEYANMTIKPYGEISEVLTLEDDLFIGDNDKVEISFPNLNTEWNLSKIEFNLYNVQHGSIASMLLEIADPYGSLHTWDGGDISNYEHYGDTATNGTWIDLIIEPVNGFQATNNNFTFQIDGSFIGTVQLVAEATFIRDEIHVDYFESNITDSIIIPSDGNGWVIKNITFEITNCQYISGGLVDPATVIDNITTNEGYFVSDFYDHGNGYGKLTINDTMIYPLDDKFSFIIGNNSEIIFDVKIKVEYIQEFYENQYLEVISNSNTINNFAKGSFSINPNSDWVDQGTMLYIENLNNGFIDVFPSEVAMNITIDGITYYFQDGTMAGHGYLLLEDILKDELLTALIQANDSINLNLKFTINYLREVNYETSATITYEIRGEDISGSAPYDSEFGYYRASIDTSLVDADDYTIRFSATKLHYNIGQEDLDLEVKERLTLLNGSSTFYAKYYQIIAMEGFNYTLWYLDNYTYQPLIDLTEKSYTWEKYGNQGEIIESGEGDLIVATDNSYLLDFDTENRDTGDYFFVINFKKNNYVSKYAFITLNIIDRPTLINGVSQLATIQTDIYISEQLNFTFTYVDKYNVNITDLDIQSYEWRKFDGAGNLVDSGSGNLITGDINTYILDFNTEVQSVGRYVFNITLGKDKYEFKTAEIILRINLREIEYNLGDTFKNKQINVVKGEIVTLEIELTDPLDDSPIEGAKVVLEIGNKEYEFDEVDDGVYELEFDTKKYEAFMTSNTLTGTIKISKDNYESEEIDITIVVEMEEIVDGVPTFYFLTIVGVIAAIVGSLATYRYIQIARIPGFVKKARNIKKAIKSKESISESLLYPTKEEYMVKELEDKYNRLGVSIGEQLGVKMKKGKIDLIKKQGGNT